MKKINPSKIALFLCTLLCVLPSQVFPLHQLRVHNCILAEVNGKRISTLDVLKKMEQYAEANYPELKKDPYALFHFLSNNWRPFLTQLVDQSLILADAEHVEIKISPAEIREALHQNFGPKISENLSTQGLSFDDAWQMTYADLAIQRMSWFRLQSKAMASVGPSDIRKAYQTYLQASPSKETWEYQVLSLTSPSPEGSKWWAEQTLSWIDSFHFSPEELLAYLQSYEKTENAQLQYTLSKRYTSEGRSLSNQYLQSLRPLKEGEWSSPIQIKTKDPTKSPYKLLYLHKYTVTPPASFEEMAPKLHNELLSKALRAEQPAYLKKLRANFHVKEYTTDSDGKPLQLFRLVEQYHAPLPAL